MVQVLDYHPRDLMHSRFQPSKSLMTLSLNEDLTMVSSLSQVLHQNARELIFTITVPSVSLR